MKTLYIIPDYKGTPSYGIEQSDYINMYVMNAGDSVVETIPAGAGFALFNATGNFLCRFNTPCPANANITDGSGGELNPVVRRLKDTNSFPYTTINIYAIQSCTIMIAYYAAQLPGH